MLRQIDLPNIQAGFPRWTGPRELLQWSRREKGKMLQDGGTDFTMMLATAAVGRANADGRVRSVCLESLAASTAGYDEAMRASVEFLEIPDAANGSTAWEQAGPAIRGLDARRMRTERPQDAHRSMVGHAEKRWLEFLVRKLDEKHLGGFVTNVARMVGCAELPPKARGEGEGGGQGAGEEGGEPPAPPPRPRWHPATSAEEARHREVLLIQQGAEGEADEEEGGDNGVLDENSRGEELGVDYDEQDCYI
jgi:hypothetical protein